MRMVDESHKGKSGRTYAADQYSVPDPVVQDTEGNLYPDWERRAQNAKRELENEVRRSIKDKKSGYRIAKESLQSIREELKKVKAELQRARHDSEVAHLVQIITEQLSSVYPPDAVIVKSFKNEDELAAHGFDLREDRALFFKIRKDELSECLGEDVERDHFQDLSVDATWKEFCDQATARARKAEKRGDDLNSKKQELDFRRSAFKTVIEETDLGLKPNQLFGYTTQKAPRRLGVRLLALLDALYNTGEKWADGLSLTDLDRLAVEIWPTEIKLRRKNPTKVVSAKLFPGEKTNNVPRLYDRLREWEESGDLKLDFERRKFGEDEDLLDRCRKEAIAHFDPESKKAH